jgi:hypothetical protein
MRLPLYHGLTAVIQRRLGLAVLPHHVSAVLAPLVWLATGH